MLNLKSRDGVSQADVWSIEDVFSSWEAWDAELDALAQLLPSLAAFKGTLNQKNNVLDWLTTSVPFSERLEKLSIYVYMQTSTDMSDEFSQAKQGQVESFEARVMGMLAFAEPELLNISMAQFSQWAQEDAQLDLYRPFFEKLQKGKPYVQSAEIEAILGALSEPFQTARQIHPILTNGELNFGQVQTDSATVDIRQSNVADLLAHPDRGVRKTVWENYANGHLQHKNTLSQCFLSGVKQNVFLAKTRGYANSLEAALEPDRLSSDVFETFIRVFQANQHVWHRYWNVRKRFLGYSEQFEYDIKAPLASNPPNIPYSQAVQWICEGMAPLGENYVNVMRAGLTTERWVDIYPSQNKRLGAFSLGNSLTKPYIFMSYQDNLNGLSTLAHEVGHSMHSYLSTHNQPPIYARYSTFAAEVASNFNQAMVRDYLYRNATDRDFKIALIEEAMGNFHRYFLVMPTLARFELEVHKRVEQGEAIGSSDLNSLMATLLRECYGSEIHCDDAMNGIMWAQFNHIYANFYTWQYGTGIAAAHHLAFRVLEEGKSAADLYLKFLSAGGKLSPIEALRLAGVDMTQPEPIEAGFRILEQWIDRLESLI